MAQGQLRHKRRRCRALPGPQANSSESAQHLFRLFSAFVPVLTFAVMSKKDTGEIA